MCYAYGCDNYIIIFNSSKSQVIFFVFDTMKYCHMKNIMLGQNTLNVTKSYTYLGNIITDNLCCGLTIGRRPCRVSLFHTITLSEFYIICILRCSASFMFANAVVASCFTCIRKSIYIQFNEPVEHVHKHNCAEYS